MGPGEEPRLAGQAEYQVGYYAIAVRGRGGTRPVGVSQAVSSPPDADLLPARDCPGSGNQL